MPDGGFLEAAAAASAAAEVGGAASIDSFVIGSYVSAAGLGTSTVTGAGLITGATILKAVGSVALSIGLNYAANLLLHKDQPLEQRQSTLKQPLPGRWIDIGRVKSGGALFFYESPDALLFIGKVWSCTRINAIEGVYLDNNLVTLDPVSGIAAGVYGGHVSCFTHLGSPFQDADTTLQAYFNGSGVWSAAHQLKGLAYGVELIEQVSQKDFAKTFPNGAPNMTAVIQAALLPDPRDGAQNMADPESWTYSDNAALAVLRYCLDVDGWGLQLADIDLDSFKVAADDAGEMVLCIGETSFAPLSSPWTYTNPGPTVVVIEISNGIVTSTKVNGVLMGTTSLVVALQPGDAIAIIYTVAPDLHQHGYVTLEPRYRAWGRYTTLQEKRAVVADLLANCAGHLTEGPDGKISLRVGQTLAPAVTIDDSHVISVSLDRWGDALDRTGEVKARITAENFDWQEKDVAPVRLEDPEIDIANESTDLALSFCPSPYQAQRLAKATLRRLNPEWSGSITTTLYGLKAIGESCISLALSDPPVNATFEIIGQPAVDFQNMMVTIKVQSFASDTFVFNVLDYQLLADNAAVVEIENSVTAPTIADSVIGGTGTKQISITWTDDVSFEFAAQYRPFVSGQATDAGWISLTAVSGSAVTPVIAAGHYDVRVNKTSPRGFVSSWSVIANITV